ncbi:MAG: T9SS type A sorting domain-containing protein [Cytophagales bacterium]|nr:T9SS type A sorting domain-containing protein [Cytophagales bacterium]
MKVLDKLIILVAMLATTTSFAQTTATVSGNWNNTATWGGNPVPTAGDVIISTGVEVIFNADHGNANSVTISSLDIQGTGSLIFPYSDDAELDAGFTLTVTGAVTVASTASMANREGDSGVTLAGLSASRSHVINFRGDITNDGTIGLGVTTNGYAPAIDFETNNIAYSGSGTSTYANAEVRDAAITLTYTGTGTFNVESQFDLQNDGAMTVNTSSGIVNFGSSTTDGGNAFEFEGNNTTFTLTDGTVNVDVNNSTDGQRVFQVDGTGVVLNVNGGTLNIGDLTTTGAGTVRITNQSTDFDFNIAGGTVNIADNIDFQNATSYMDLNISSGAMYVGTQDLGAEGNSELLNGVLTMTGGTLEYGENLNLDVLPTLSGGAVFSVGTNADFGTNFDIDFGNWNITTAFSFTADGGIDILAGNTLTVESGATLNIETEDVDDMSSMLDVSGTLSVEGGTVNIGGSAQTQLDTDLVIVQDGGAINILDGTFNLVTAATDGSQNTANFLELRETTSTLTVGDGTGSASTAVLNIGTSIVAQGSPTEEDLLSVIGDNSLVTVNTDGELNIGGGNIGSVLLNDDSNDTDPDDFLLVVAGGILNIAGALDIRQGTGFHMSSGTTNIGLENSGGVNDIDFIGERDPNAPTIFQVTGGTLSVGDGAMVITLGDEDDNPAYGSTTAYHEFEITGGTVNINGRLRQRDYNSRLILGGNATINFDAQAATDQDPDQNQLYLEAGIVNITGPVNINFIDPAKSTGTGEILAISQPGNTQNERITASFDGLGSDAIDFSNVTWGFGDGTSTSSSADGFDLSINTGHTNYGNWVINDPGNREVNFINSGNSYVVGDVTITQGILNMGTNNFDDDGTDGTFTIGSGGVLKLDTDFPGHTSDAFGTYSMASGSYVDYNGSATISNGHVPTNAAFGSLTVSGSGTVNLAGAGATQDTVFLTNGTLAAGTNLTMNANSVISKSAGTLTGTLQGANTYTVRYTGTSRSTDPGIDTEWSGSGTKSLAVDMDGGQTLTISNTALAIDDLSINSGILTDASLAHTVAGNLVANGSYTGTGSIALTGGASSHSITSTGTATLSNLIMNDANGASGDLSFNITGSLTLTEGILNVGSGTFTLASGATITGGGSTTFVAFDGASSSGGMVQTFTSSTDSKTYPIGIGTAYKPFQMALNSGSSFGALTVVPVTGGSQFTLDGSNTLDIDFYWLVNDGGNFSDTNADFTYNYDDSDIRGVESSYISARYDVSNPEWTTSDETTDGTDGVNAASNEATLKGVEFTDGHFTAGEEDEFAGVITTFYLISGVSDHDWNNGAHWTNTDGGSTPINRTPGTNSPVIIKGDDVTIDADGQSAGSITIESDGVMIIGENGGTPTTGHSFGTVSGTGTLRIVSGDTDAPTFPSENGADWSSFLGASGGTVEYSGNGGYLIPTAGGSYNNLVISSTSASANTKTLPNEDLTITGTFDVSGGFGTTVNISDDNNGNLSVTGNVTIASGDVLSFGSTNNRTVAFSGDLSVAGTFNVANSGTASHNLTISGSLTSTGTFDMNTGGSTVATTFNSASNTSITGAGSADFDRLIVNVGSSQATTLTADVTTLSITDQGSEVAESSIEFQNGTLVVSSASTVVLSNNGDVSIPATSALTLNNSSADFSLSTSGAGTLILSGGITISSGSLNVGDVTDNATDNSIRYEGTAGSISVDGSSSVLNVGGAIRPNVIDGSTALAFSLTNDGIVSIARNTSTNNRSVTSVANRSEADFVLDNAASSFTMSGTNTILEIVRSETSDGKAISITSAVTNATVTGGTVKVLQDAHDVGTSGITNTTNTSNDISAYSSIAFYNFSVGDGDYEGDYGAPDSSDATVLDLQVSNNLTINLNDDTADNGRFDFFRVDQTAAGNNDEANVVVGGNLTVTSGNIQVADGGDGGTVTFNGTGDQTLTTNGEIFGDITVNKASGSLILADALTIYGDWTHTQGTLNQGGNLITMTTPIGLQGSTITGDPTFDALTLSNTSGVTQTSGTTTLSSSGVLTISDNVIYDLGENGLSIQNQTTPFAGISVPGGADNTNMIRVSGTDAGVGLTYTYPDASTSGFIFPIGATINATDYYLPAQINLTAGGGAGSTANVTLITTQHPQVSDAENALNLYWSVTASSFNGSQTATHTYTYGSTSTDVVEGGDDTNFLDALNAGSPTFNWTEGSTTNVSGQVITFTDPGSDNIAGDFTAGVDAAFNPVTVFYTIRDGDWNNTATTTTPWTNDECAAGVRNEVTGIEPGSGDPVVICSGNTVTITTATGLASSGVEINGTLNSQIDDISTLNDISGNGTLAFDHTTATTPTFGTLASAFISGGTLDYGGTMAYTLPTNTNYHNLTLTNSGGLTLPNDVSLTGAFNMTAGSLTTGGFNLSGTGTFTMAASTTLTVSSSGSAPSGFSSYTFDATSTVDYSGGNQTILGGVTYGNLDLSRTSGDPASKTLDGNIVIVGDLDIGRRTELASSSFNVELQGNLTLDTRNNTNFDPGTGTFTFGGANAQSITFSNGSESETFNNLIIDKSGGSITASGVTDFTVSGALTITNGSLGMSSLPLTVEGTTTISSGASLTSSTTIDFNGDFSNAGTFTVPSTVTLAGNFNNTGTYTSGNNTLTLDNTTTAQSITGATTFNNLTIAKASGVDVTFNNAVTIDGTLSLANEGNIILSSGDLTISDGATITGNAGGTTSSDFGATRMIRTDGSGTAPAVVKNGDDSDVDWDLVFPVGVRDGGVDKYTPVTVGGTTDQIASTGTLSVRSVNGVSTDQSISSSATTLNRHFDLDITGIGGAVTFDLVFQYDDSDVQGSESDYNAAYSERSVDDGWNQPVASVTNVNAGNNQFGASATLNGTIDFSAAINTEWIAGNNDLLFPRYFTRAGGGVDCSLGCDWNDGTNWTLDDGGTTSAGSVPGADNAVTISSGHTMTMDNNTNSAQSITLTGTLDIAGTSGHSLGEITGTGTLEIDASGLEGYVDTGSGSTFFGQNGGTVSYLGDAAYNLPTVFTEYNNLTIGGTTQDSHDKSLGIGLIIFGNLTLGNTDLENPSDLSLELRGSFTSSGGNFNVADGTFVFSNTATANLPGNLTFGSAGSLTLDNFGEKDLTGALVIENLSINSSSGTFDANSNTITVTGNWDNQASSNLLSNPGTVTFNGADAQQIDGDNTFAAVNISTSSTAVTIGSGTQTSGAITLATGTSLTLGTNTLRVDGALDVDQGTFSGASGTVVFTSTTDPETQADAITVATLEIDKGASTNTFDNDPQTVTFTNLVVTSGEYDGPDLNIPGNFSVASGAAIDVTGISTMDLNGDFTVGSTLNLSGLTSMSLSGNLINNGTFTPPATVTLDGASAQTISGSSATGFTNLEVNNTDAGTADVTLNANVSISGHLDFQDGIVVPGTGTLTFNDNATVRYDGVAETTPTGGSNDGNSFVAGAVSKIGDDDFVFPIGEGSRYARLGIQPQSGDVADQYTGQYSFAASASATATKAGDIVRVSGLEHWDLTRDNGSTNVIPTLFYDGSSGVNAPSRLLVAHYNGSVWEDLGNAAFSSGTVTAASPMTSFSPVTLATSKDDTNPLPVEMLYFEAGIEQNSVSLEWSTASELNNDFFEVQRSLDGINYEVLAEVSGNGSTDEVHVYHYEDRFPIPGVQYYRLRQVDFDGAFEYSDIIVVEYAPNGSQFKAKLFPNPMIEQEMTVELQTNDFTTPVSIEILDLAGRLVTSERYEVSSSNNQMLIDVSDLQTGTYLIRIRQRDQLIILKRAVMTR